MGVSLLTRIDAEQAALWGGELVFKNVELRLDVLQVMSPFPAATLGNVHAMLRPPCVSVHRQCAVERERLCVGGIYIYIGRDICVRLCACLLVCMYVSMYVFGIDACEISNNALPLSQEELGLPVVFTRGFIQELKVYLPLANLLKESIKITLNNVEVVAQVIQMLDPSCGRFFFVVSRQRHKNSSVPAVIYLRLQSRGSQNQRVEERVAR
jgi:hypothetical protein